MLESADEKRQIPSQRAAAIICGPISLQADQWKRRHSPLIGLLADHPFDDVTRLHAAGIYTERPELELRISQH
jgi:hypothetical protein